MRKKLLTRTALGIGSFNLAYAAETEDTSSGKKINVMASFYPMYDFVEHLEEYRIAGKNYRTHISLWNPLLLV